VGRQSSQVALQSGDHPTPSRRTMFSKQKVSEYSSLGKYHLCQELSIAGVGVPDGFLVFRALSVLRCLALLACQLCL
jgi:hypothetical protein